MNITNSEKLKSETLKIIQRRKGGDLEIIQNWFSNNFVKWFLSSDRDSIKNVVPHRYSRGEPEWMNKPNIYDFTSYNNETDSFLEGKIINENDILYIVDYFQSLSPKELGKILKQTPPIIFEKTKEFLNTNCHHRLIEDSDYKVFMEIKNGWKWVELLTKDAYLFEGQEMGHCVGNYDPDEQRILSLWDKKGKSHVTIEIWRDEVCQIKGKENKAPESKYVKVVSEFAESLLESGVPTVNDGHNIGWLSYNPNKILKKIKQIPDPITEKVICGRRYINPITPNGKKVLDSIIKPHRIIRLGSIIENCVNEDDKITLKSVECSFDVSDLHFSKFDEIFDTIESQKKEILESIIDRIGTGDPKKINKIIRILNQFKSLNKVEDLIDISGNLFKDLNDIPICKFLIANNNYIKSLAAIPDTCTYIWAENNRLESLESLTSNFCGSLLVQGNNIKNLCEKSQRLNNLEQFNISHNRLKSLAGSPKVVGSIWRKGYFRCSHNLLQSLEHGPEVVYGDYDVSKNPLSDISSLPRTVTGNFYISKTSLCDQITLNFIKSRCLVKGKVYIL